MSAPELLILTVLRSLVEVALLFLIDQALLGILVGKGRDSNAIYQLFALLTRPVLSFVRRISPPQIIDKHLPVVAILILFWLWIGLAYLNLFSSVTPWASAHKSLDRALLVGGFSVQPQ